MIRVFDTEKERTKNLRADDAVILTTINCDGVERFWCATSIDEFKRWWWSEDYDGPAGDDEVTEFTYAGETVWGVSRFEEIVNMYGFSIQNKSLIEFTQYESLEKIKDSVQLSSDTVIATLRTPRHFLSLEVRGEIKIYFDENLTGEPIPYSDPSQYPESLANIIAGKAPHWALDEHVDVSANNWFEVFWGKDEMDRSDSLVVDAEGLTTEQIMHLLLKLDKEAE